MFTLLLFVCGAEPVPTFKVENKVPPFVVVNKIEQPAPTAAPVRENWGGSWGWMERGPDGVYRQVSQGVSQPATKKTVGLPTTDVPSAATYPGPAVGVSQSSASQPRVIYTLAPNAVPWANTDNCGPVG